MATKEICLGLDVGSRRIGVALGDTISRIATPLLTLNVSGTEMAQIQTLIREHEVTHLVVGLPRNASGAETQQSVFVRNFTDRQLASLHLPIVFQDESVTSVLAEQRLMARKKPYHKADIDAEAAAIILQDYLESRHAGHHSI